MFESSKWAVYFATGDRIEDEVTGIEDVQKNVTLTCYPNPFESEISLALTEDFALGGEVEVMNLMGQRLYDVEASSSAGRISLKFDNLPSGQYIIRIRDGSSVGTCRAVKHN